MTSNNSVIIDLSSPLTDKNDSQKKPSCKNTSICKNIPQWLKDLFQLMFPCIIFTSMIGVLIFVVCWWEILGYIIKLFE